MTSDVEVVAARNEQSKASKRATFDLLKSKKRAEREFEFTLNDEKVSLLFRAIGANEYDKLVSKAKPTVEQKADGANYDINVFGPALLAAVSIEPEMSAAQWKEIWTSPEWSRGEVVQLFYIASELCNRGLDIPFTENV
jgi:hypothetical protein